MLMKLTKERRCLGSDRMFNALEADADTRNQSKISVS